MKYTIEDTTTCTGASYLRITGVLKYILLCLLLSITDTQYARAADELRSEYSFRLFTHRDGLPGMMINCLFQDSKGYIWLGCNNGLVRYDGTHFYPLLSDSDISIVRITETTTGQIEAFTPRNVYIISPDGRYERKLLAKDQRICPHTSRSLPQGYAVYETLAMDKRSLYAIRDSVLEKVWEHPDVDESDNVHALYWDRKNGRYYFNRGIYIEEDSLVTHLPETESDLWCFVPATDGVWAIGSDGIYKLMDNRLQKTYNYPFSLGTGIYGLIDKEGYLIIKDAEHVYQYANGRLEVIYSHIKYASDILLDKEGNLWVSSFEGLYCFFRRHFKNYILSDKADVVRSVLADADNRVWFGTLNGHLIRLDNDKVEYVNYQEDASGNFFHPFPSIQGNTLFFNTPMILSYTGRSFRYADVPFAGYLFSAALPDGNMVATNNSRLIIFNSNGKLVRSLSHQELLQPPRQAAMDKRGRIWVTGMNGISIVEADKISLMDADSLRLSYLIFPDANNDIWFTVRNRLYVYKEDRIQLKGVYKEPINGFRVTKEEVLVVVTDAGLYLSSPETPTPKFYNYNNGFMGTANFAGNIAEDRQGNMYVMTMEHVTRFHPRELIYEQPVPRLYFKNIKSSADNIGWTEPENEHLSFDHRNNHIKIAYTGICYAALGNLFYRYRLQGFQNEWSQSQLGNEVVFNNLPPGHYVFEVKAHSGLTEAESPVVSIPFSIRPAFWQTIWFPFVLATGLMLLGAGIVFIIQRRKNKVLFEQLKTEKELNELRIRSIRLKAIPHFNANVLAAIEYHIANRTKEEAMRILDIYSKFTLKTLSEVSKAARPLSEELAYVKMYLDLEKIRFLDKFDFQIHVEEGVDRSVELPNMILHTYCENAVKHGLMPLKSGGLLTIQVSQCDSVVCVSVEDNGVGRTSAAQSPQMHSTKQGLLILNRQIEIYNHFNSEPIHQQIDDLVDHDGKPKGTRFTVEVPLHFVYVN